MEPIPGVRDRAVEKTHKWGVPRIMHWEGRSKLNPLCLGAPREALTTESKADAACIVPVRAIKTSISSVFTMDQSFCRGIYIY